MRVAIRVKLVGGFLIVLALMLVVFGVGYNGLRQLATGADGIANSAELDDASMKMHLALLEGMDVEARMLVSGDWAGADAEFQASVDLFDQAEDTFTAIGTDQQKVLLKELVADHEDFREAVGATMA